MTIVLVLLFAAIGLFLTAGFVAVKFGLTNSAGRVDLNDRYFQNLARKHQQAKAGDPVPDTDRILARLLALQAVHPQNASLILTALGQHRDPRQAERMLDAIEPYLSGDARYQERVRALAWAGGGAPDRVGSAYPWMNSEEWQAFRGGVLKDREVLQRASQATDVPTRLIVTMMVSEQIRLFNAQRESFKACFAPLKILGNETKFSLGVCGIKDETGKNIEANLKNPASAFYPGPRFQHLLDYPLPLEPGPALSAARYQRLTEASHYYSYLYTAVYLQQILNQWRRAGYDLSERPEILATLFNIGFEHSAPGPSPQVGGAAIAIGGKTYSFGSLAYEFYYSGDLAEAFPYPQAANPVRPS